MNSKLFCSAVMFVVFICIVANFNNNKGIANKLISLFLLLAAVSSILSSSKSDSSLENFVSTPQEEQKRIEELQKALIERKNFRKKLKVSSAELECTDRRIVSLGAGYHPLQDVPACVDGESMLHFNKSVCKPECCDFGKNNGFSCSTGCVCKE
jgi:hypothetical protein